MKVVVRFFASVREITRRKEEELEFSHVITLKELLTQLSKIYDEKFTDYLFDGKGNVRSYIQILVNGRGISLLEGFKTKLKDGDKIAIFPPVGGG